MLNYLGRYGSDSKYPIPVARLAKELRIDKDIVRKNLAELFNAGLVEINPLKTIKRGRPRLVCSLSEQFENFLQQPNKVPEYAAIQLEALGLHAHHSRTGYFRNELKLSKSQSLLLGVLIAHCKMPGLVHNLSQKDLSNLTGEKIPTIKQYLKTLKVAGVITELWPGLVDKDLVGRQAAGYLINFHTLTSSKEEKACPMSSYITGNLESIPKLAVLEPLKHTGTLPYAFDHNVQKFYTTQKIQYLEQLKEFDETIQPLCRQTHLFICWQTASLISTIFREHWQEVNSEQRISIQVINTLIDKYLEHLLLIFKGSKVKNYRRPQMASSYPEPLKNENSFYNSLQNKFRQDSCAISAYCFFFFFDSLRLAIELAQYLKLSIPELDHTTALFYADLFITPVFHIVGFINQREPPDASP